MIVLNWAGSLRFQPPTPKRGRALRSGNWGSVVSEKLNCDLARPRFLAPPLRSARPRFGVGGWLRGCYFVGWVFVL